MKEHKKISALCIEDEPGEWNIAYSFVEIEEPLPKDTILNITVAPAGYPIVLYRMTGEIRWVSDAGGRYHIGIKLFEVDDADRWQNDFDERFAAAV